MKRTRWYPCSVKPVRVGMYQSRCWITGKIRWRYWTGNKWGWAYEHKRWAYSWRHEDGATQTDQWRGVTKP